MGRRSCWNLAFCLVCLEVEVQISRCSGSGSRNCGLISFRRNGKQVPRGVCVPACVSECVCQPVIRGFGSGAIYWAVEAKELEGPIENNSFSISKQNPQSHVWLGSLSLGSLLELGNTTLVDSTWKGHRRFRSVGIYHHLWFSPSLPTSSASLHRRDCGFLPQPKLENLRGGRSWFLVL